MGMETRKRGRRIARITAAAAIAALPLATITSYADTRVSSDASFQVQYNQNTTLESSLLKTAESYSYQSSQTVTLCNRIKTLNREIKSLYSFRQFLLSGRVQPGDIQRLSSEDSWKTWMEWAQSWHADTDAFAKSHAEKEQHKHNKDDHDGNERDWNNLKAQLLVRVDNTILQLQQAAIQNVRQWIAIELKYGSQTPSQPAAVAVWSSASTVNTGGAVTYTVQVLNANHQSLKQAGVKVDVGLTASNQDGTLTATTANTDADGRVSVTVLAGQSSGSIQLSAWLDGTTNTTVASSVTKVVDPLHFATHLVLTAGSIPATLMAGQSFGGAGYTVMPENIYNQVVAGDTLRVTTSNASVLALQSPDSVGGTEQTLSAGTYTLPIITAKSAGTATLTITDISAAGAPKVTYNVSVTVAQPIRIVGINPLGTQASYYVSAAGLAGPFTVAVTDVFGNVVPATDPIELTAAEVNRIIGTGTGIRLSQSGADVSSIVIGKGQTGVTVFADNATMGATSPISLALSNIVPAVKSVVVKDASTVVVTYDQTLDATKVPTATDFSVTWGSGSGTPQSVSIAGNVVTLKLWGNAISHGSSVYVSYSPGSDANALRTVWGVTAGNYTNFTASNPL